MYTMVDRIFRGTKINSMMKAVIIFIGCIALYFTGIAVFAVISHMPFRSLVFEPMYLGCLFLGAGFSACKVYEKSVAGNNS